jgi:hypothetical protein
MVRRSARAAERVAAPSLAPDEAAVDLVHLGRMTLGEPSLQREVLALFDRQAELLLARMRDAAPAAVAALAHTFTGSARGIGAWHVAAAAEAVEAAARGECAELAGALSRLAAATGAARATIATLLAAGSSGPEPAEPALPLRSQD